MIADCRLSIADSPAPPPAGCVHRWVCEPPSMAARGVPGRCRLCGVERVFAHPDYTELSKPEQRRRHAESWGFKRDSAPNAGGQCGHCGRACGSGTALTQHERSCVTKDWSGFVRCERCNAPPGKACMTRDRAMPLRVPHRGRERSEVAA